MRIPFRQYRGAVVGRHDGIRRPRLHWQHRAPQHRERRPSTPELLLGEAGRDLHVLARPLPRRLPDIEKRADDLRLPYQGRKRRPPAARDAQRPAHQSLDVGRLAPPPPGRAGERRSAWFPPAHRGAPTSPRDPVSPATGATAIRPRSSPRACSDRRSGEALYPHVAEQAGQRGGRSTPAPNETASSLQASPKLGEGVTASSRRRAVIYSTLARGTDSALSAVYSYLLNPVREWIARVGSGGWPDRRRCLGGRQFR